MPRIVFTGGGTAGHVTPNIALIDKLKQEGWHMDYIGSADGVEKNMIKEIHIPYHVIKSGKLRYEAQKFFDIKRRVNTWLQNKNKYGNSKDTDATAASRKRMDELSKWINR